MVEYVCIEVKNLEVRIEQLEEIIEHMRGNRLHKGIRNFMKGKRSAYTEILENRKRCQNP